MWALPRLPLQQYLAKTVVWYHSQDTDIDTAKTENNPTATRILLLPFRNLPSPLHHTCHLPDPWHPLGSFPLLEHFHFQNVT